MTHQYESELIKEIVEARGHEKSSLHYESECIESWIEENKGAYPKLCDYQSEWLNYINENIGIGDFPYVTLTDVTDATINNTVPFAYKSAILKGQTIKVYQDNLFDGIVESGGLGVNNGENDDRYPSRGRSANFIKVEPNSTITFARNLGTDGFHVVGYNENKEFVKGFVDVMKANVLVGKINTTSDIYYIKFYDIAPTSESEFGVFQGDVEPNYELLSVKMPVLTTSNEDGTKTNILTVNEDVTLRSNGDICDELNLLTGQLTQRIGEDGVVLSQEVVKTVDLLVQDQNGNIINKIKPIEGTMHLSTSSDTINPLFSGEIPVEATTQNLASFINLEMEE